MWFHLTYFTLLSVRVSGTSAHTRSHWGCETICVRLCVNVGRLWVSFWCSVSRSSVAGPSVNRMTTTQCVCMCVRVCVCVWHGDAVIDETVAILANAKRTYPWREKMPQHTHTRAATALPNYPSSQGSAMSSSHICNKYTQACLNLESQTNTVT